MTEAQRKEREAELFQLKFDEGILLSKRVLRVQPIGTDRNHNRYWVFSDGTPGLYVEKGTQTTFTLHPPYTYYIFLAIKASLKHTRDF